MKAIKIWDIQVWDGGDRHNHRYYVSSKDAADQWKEKNKYDYVTEKELIIFDDYDELMHHVSGEARKRALAKLTEEDKLALGLK